jgi:hypothetical protein
LLPTAQCAFKIPPADSQGLSEPATVQQRCVSASDTLTGQRRNRRIQGNGSPDRVEVLTDKGKLAVLDTHEEHILLFIDAPGVGSTFSNGQEDRA